MTSSIISIIDDDPAVLDAIGVLLRSKGFDVRPHSGARSFLVSDPDSHCILSDVRMPDMSGIELLRRLKAANDPRPVVLLTGHGDIAMAVQAIKEGACDFIEKPFDNERLLRAILDALHRSEPSFAEAPGLSQIQSRLNSLTERQKEVMGLIVQGFTNKDVAERLGISARTVEVYRAAVMQKMGARSLADLVRLSVRVER